jgi:hypothetical protein
MAAGVAGIAAGLAGGLLVLAGIAKLRDGQGLVEFLVAVGLARRLSRAVGRVAPGCELVCGAWLLSRRGSVAAAAAAVLLSAVFVALQGVALHRGVVRPCRCFGALDASSSHRVALARALLLLGASSAALAGGVASAAGTGSPGDVMSGVLLAVCGVVVVAFVAEVAAFRSGVRRALATASQHTPGGQR